MVTRRAVHVALVTGLCCRDQHMAAYRSSPADTGRTQQRAETWLARRGKMSMNRKAHLTMVRDFPAAAILNHQLQKVA